ncbi:3-(3-hydroxyphenyl)propionate hydroxylase [Pseudomonas fluorescens]|uniref:3-(3-hydroxyphenyl)propionate hydroxylase n=1 Tax=Pseudomonas fluorescens TaxID=294 RepID=A0A379IF34_PSEFL|nr:bifunctional 3-(3-hydroxy-phenyl)propionate/3-hydroxycinnamic acid hydroxylase [Pseudomonas fluorescens]SUD31460.1 3-(3-hydroxyphenyl)propionate hydroxylase [Pseudomonas fluorescens]
MQIFDVVIVGFGPVGQLLCSALAQKGHRVAVVERWPEVYPLPRAVCYDHEIRRILESVGIREPLNDLSRAGCLYQWFNADWKLLTQFDWTQDSISGGPFGYFFNQPQLEEVLSQLASEQSTATLFRGHEVVALDNLDSHCELRIKPVPSASGEADEQMLQARYVIGADGANSFVRRSQNIEWADLGFSEDWLVVDVEPNPGVNIQVPDFAQWCNPARPTTMVPGGPVYRRWEFMRLPNETIEQLEADEHVWSLLAQWIKPNEGRLIRKAVYHFRSLIAAQWRKGRVLLAGDAAHLMPPFMGQGMCTGMRDAWNLAWKLDLILSGAAHERVLDDYMPERRRQVEAVIDASVTMGKVVCQADPLKALARDKAFLAGEIPQPDPFPAMDSGLLQRDRNGCPGTLAGTLGPHSDVAVNNVIDRLDQWVPRGFHLLTFDADLLASLTTAQRADCEAIGVHPIVLRCADDLGEGFVDVNGVYQRYFQKHAIKALLIRPDYYVFGALTDQTHLAQLLAQLNHGLGRETQSVASPAQAMALTV